MQLDSDNTYSILLYGFGAVLAVYLTSAIVGSLESVPLVSSLEPPFCFCFPSKHVRIYMLSSNILFCFQLPKLMEVVGLGYTLWFTTRYLLFKVWNVL